jgi:hypothetical protein
MESGMETRRLTVEYMAPVEWQKTPRHRHQWVLTRCRTEIDVARLGAAVAHLAAFEATGTGRDEAARALDHFGREAGSELTVGALRRRLDAVPCAAATPTPGA